MLWNSKKYASVNITFVITLANILESKMQEIDNEQLGVELKEIDRQINASAAARVNNLPGIDSLFDEQVSFLFFYYRPIRFKYLPLLIVLLLTRGGYLKGIF